MKSLVTYSSVKTTGGTVMETWTLLMLRTHKKWKALVEDENKVKSEWNHGRETERKKTDANI